MIDFSRRSEELEFIDVPGRVDADEMAVMLREWTVVNRWLGGVDATLDPLKKLIERMQPRDGKPVRVVDFGAGAADSAVALVQWARRQGRPIRITALDVNLDACQWARRTAAQYPEIDVVCGDAFTPCVKPGQFDFVLCSAMLHHFTEPQIVQLLNGFRDLAPDAIVVNDPHRSRVAYLGVRLLTLLLSRSKAVKNDGPLSVLKGFRRIELERIMQSCRFRDARISWKWAFRYAVVIPLAGRMKQIENASY